MTKQNAKGEDCMKIIFIANRCEIGGAHKALENTLINLSKRHSIVLLTPNKNSKWFDFCIKYNIKCIYIKYYEVGYAFNIPNVRKIIKFCFLPLFFILNRLNFFNAKKLNKIINICEFDYIHTNTNRDDFGILLSKIYGIKHIMQLREFDTEFFKIKYLKNKIYNYFGNNTFMFISVSDAVKENYVKKGINPNKIITVYDSIDSSQIKIKSSYNIDNIYKIVMVSNICEEKGQKKVIDAINSLKNKKRIRFDIFGTGSQEYINYLKKYIKKENLEDIVFFNGYDNEIKCKLYNYDIAVMCSKTDGFGLVTVEYMLAGLPVLIPDTGANREIVSDYKTGFIFDYNSAESLKDKLEYMLFNYDETITVAKRGRKSSIARFGVNNYIKSLEKIYENGVR